MLLKHVLNTYGMIFTVVAVGVEVTRVQYAAIPTVV